MFRGCEMQCRFLLNNGWQKLWKSVDIYCILFYNEGMTLIGMKGRLEVWIAGSNMKLGWDMKHWNRK